MRGAKSLFTVHVGMGTWAVRSGEGERAVQEVTTTTGPTTWFTVTRYERGAPPRTVCSSGHSVGLASFLGLRNAALEGSAIGEEPRTLGRHSTRCDVYRFEAKLDGKTVARGQVWGAGATLAAATVEREGAEVERYELIGLPHQGWGPTGAEADPNRPAVTPATLAASYQRGERRFSGLELRGQNFTGACLSGVDLSRSDLRGAQLDQADLSGAKLTGTRLEGASLVGATLVKVVLAARLDSACLAGANLDGATLDGVTLVDADLTGAKLTRVTVTNGTFSGARLTGADLSGAHLRWCHLDGADLTNAVLRGARLEGLTYHGYDEALFPAAQRGGSHDVLAPAAVAARVRPAILRGANLREAHMSGQVLSANFDGADFSGASLEGVLFSRCVLAQARFDRARLERVTFDASLLVGASFTNSEQVEVSFPGSTLEGVIGLDATGAEVARLLAGANGALQLAGAKLDRFELVGRELVGATLRGASLQGAKLSRARLVGASLESARLDHADLTGADLTDARLSGASLVGANLEGACLRRAQLAGATLDDARLVGVTWDETDATWAELRMANPVPGPAISLGARARTDEAEAVRQLGEAARGKLRDVWCFRASGTWALKTDRPAPVDELLRLERSLGDLTYGPMHLADLETFTLSPWDGLQWPNISDAGLRDLLTFARAWVPEARKVFDSDSDFLDEADAFEMMRAQATQATAAGVRALVERWFIDRENVEERLSNREVESEEGEFDPELFTTARAQLAERDRLRGPVVDELVARLGPASVYALTNARNENTALCPRVLVGARALVVVVSRWIL